MNSKDIEAAKRLIAQFEGKALGRHNSNVCLFRHTSRVEVRRIFGFYRGCEIKENWKNCKIGEFTYYSSLSLPEPCPYSVRVIEPQRSPSIGFYTEVLISSFEMKIWEFRLVRVGEWECIWQRIS